MSTSLMKNAGWAIAWDTSEKHHLYRKGIDLAFGSSPYPRRASAIAGEGCAVVSLCRARVRGCSAINGFADAFALMKPVVPFLGDFLIATAACCLIAIAGHYALSEDRLGTVVASAYAMARSLAHAGGGTGSA